MGRITIGPTSGPITGIGLIMAGTAGTADPIAGVISERAAWPRDEGRGGDSPALLLPFGRAGVACDHRAKKFLATLVADACGKRGA